MVFVKGIRSPPLSDFAESGVVCYGGTKGQKECSGGRLAGPGCGSEGIVGGPQEVKDWTLDLAPTPPKDRDFSGGRQGARGGLASQ